MQVSDVVHFLEIKDDLLELTKFYKKHIRDASYTLFHAIQKMSGKPIAEHEWDVRGAFKDLDIVEAYLNTILELDKQAQRKLKKQSLKKSIETSEGILLE